VDASSELPRGTVTFLFTDIEGSTELVRELGAGFGRVRSEHRRILRDAFAMHGGHEIDTAGDGFFVVFERAGDAVSAAVAAQRATAQTQLRVRIGLHTAEPYLDDEGYVGVGVSRAARICAAGHGGQILVSHATAGIVEDLDLADVTIEDLGDHRLKDIEAPQRLFQIVVPGLETSFPTLKSLDALAPSAVITFVACDLVGWHNIVRKLGDRRAVAASRAYQRLAVDVARRHGGHEIEVMVDTVVSAFELPLDALHAASALRDALQTEPWYPEDGRPPVRMAVHSGHVVSARAGQLGLSAVRCLSLCNTAAPGQILVSHATEALLEGEPIDVELHHVGERILHGFDRLEHVYEVA